MTSWPTELHAEWDRQDALASSGRCPGCGRVDFVELGEVDAAVSRRCRPCGADWARTLPVARAA